MQGPRTIRLKEFPQLEPLFHTCFSIPKKDFVKKFPILFDRQRMDNMNVMVEKGRVASHVGAVRRALDLLGTRLQATFIGAVCTYPAFEGQGLASKLLHHVIKKDRKQGCDLLLISGFRGLYQRLGAAYVGRIAMLKGSASKIKRLLPVSVRRTRLRDIKAMHGLHQQEPVHVVRPEDDLRVIWRTKFASARDVEFYTVLLADRVAGYFVVPRPFRKDSWVVEYAGLKAALVEALPELAKKLKAKTLQFKVPSADQEMARLVREAGFRPRPAEMDFTVVVINFQGLMHKLKPAFQRILRGDQARMFKFKEKKGKYIFSLGREKFICPDRALLAKIIFGDRRGEGIRGGPKSRNLKKIFGKIFPIALPNAGISFV